MRKLLTGVLVAGFWCSAATAASSGTFVVGQRGHVLVPVSINGAEAKHFVLDTAASQTVLDPGQFPALKAVSPPPGSGFHAAHGAHGAVESQPTRLRTVALWQSELQDQPAALMSLAQLTPGHEPDFAGVLGVPYLRRYRLDLDYPKRRVTLDEIDGDQPACDICTAATAIEVTPIIGGLPTVVVNVNGQRLIALLDTGAAYSILNDAATVALGLSGVRQGSPAANVSMALGDMPPVEHEVRLTGLPVFARLGLTSPPAVILGIDFLGVGRTVLDLASNRVWFAAAAKQSTR